MENLKYLAFILIINAAACSGEAFTNTASPETGGSSGEAGTAGTAGTAGDTSGGEGGSHTQKDGGPGGVGNTAGDGGTGGGTVGGAGGTGGDTGGVGSVGGNHNGGSAGSTGGSGGNGGSGGSTAGTSSGGTGGTACVEYTYEEKITACQGNCGTISHRCSAERIDCTLIDSSNVCSLNHQWCNIESNGSGTCMGCQRETSVAKDVCNMGENKPFEYTCPSEFRNSIQDVSEVDVDCGGPYSVAKCQTGDSCESSSDCASQACVNNKCANSSLPQIGCDYYASQGVWCCNESEDSCKRVPAFDIAICNGNAFAIQCSGGVNLASQGCSINNGYWCCPQEIR